jgi:translocator protein
VPPDVSKVKSGNTEVFKIILFSQEKHMQNYNWYQQLIKPSWSPPAWLFGPVWTFLYILIAISFGTVFYKTAAKQLPLIVALPFALNIIFNLIFTPIQFGLKNNYLAALDILLVLATLIWAMVAIFPHARWIAYIQLPYLLWVIFATILHLTITYLNK